MGIGPFNSFHLRSKASSGGGADAGRECDSLVHAALISLAGHEFPLDSGAVEAAVEAGALDGMVRGAVEHRLGAVLADLLQSSGVEVPDSLMSTVAQDRIVRLQSLSMLAKVAEVFDSAGLAWACVKGPVVGSFLRRPELRRFNDLDILVAGSDLEAAVGLLRSAGIDEINRNWDGYVKHRVGEIPMGAGMVNIDLHWHLVGLGVHRKGLRLEPVEMLKRRRRRQVGQVEASILGAEDQLLHIALHSAMSGANRLDQMRDMAVLLDSDQVDLGVLAELARRYRVARLVAHALDRARGSVGADIDRSWVDDLGGRAVDARRRIDARLVDTAFLGSTLPVSMWRDGNSATLRTLLWQLRSRARDRLGRGVGWDVGDENGPLYFGREAGDAAKRAEYMAGAAVWK